MSNNGSSPLVLWYNQLGMNDVDRVGGKNASLTMARHRWCFGITNSA